MTTLSPVVSPPGWPDAHPALPTALSLSPAIKDTSCTRRRAVCVWWCPLGGGVAVPKMPRGTQIDGTGWQAGAHGAALLPGDTTVPPPQPQVRGHSTDATTLTPLFAHPRLGTPGWHHGGTQPGHPSAPLIPAAGHWGGVRGGRGQSLDRDGALAEVGLADEGVDEDGVAAAARILRGAEDGVQPLAVRAPHHEAFAPQRFGHRVVICREGTGTRLWHQRDSGGDNGATGHGPNLPAASWPPSAAPSGRCGATRSGSTHPRVTQGHQASPDQGARSPPQCVGDSGDSAHPGTRGHMPRCCPAWPPAPGRFGSSTRRCRPRR